MFESSLIFVSGVILISLALCADAVIGNVQEKAMKTHKSSNTEVVSLYTPNLHFLALISHTFSLAYETEVGKVYLQAKWPTRLELILVSVACSN